MSQAKNSSLCMAEPTSSLSCALPHQPVVRLAGHLLMLLAPEAIFAKASGCPPLEQRLEMGS